MKQLLVFTLLLNVALTIAYLGQNSVNVEASEEPQGQKLQELLSHLSVVEVPIDDEGNTVKTLRFEGVNVQIVNGLGATNGNPLDPDTTEPAETVTNGLGNLIVGYQELRDDGNDRTGSHAIIVGAKHNHTSFGALIAGVENVVSGAFSAVSGGGFNIASGVASSVSGGGSPDIEDPDLYFGNVASGDFSSVSGGTGNEASGSNSSVSGGAGGTASGGSSSVSGGEINSAVQTHASVSGGFGNVAAGGNSSISGGGNHTVTGHHSSISGGWGNTVNGQSSHICGQCGVTTGSSCNVYP